MDGLGENNAMTTPVCPNQVAFVNSKEKVKKIVKWLWPIALLVMWLAGLVAGLVTLGVWFIAKLIVNNVMNKQIREYLDQCKEERRADAARLA